MHRSRWTAVAKSVAASTAAAALLAGVPFGLVRWVGWPVDDPAAAATALRYGQVSDDLLIAFRAAVVWLGWAQLVCAFAVEVVAAARGRLAPRVAAVSLMQPLAARLVGAALVAWTLSARSTVAAAALPPEAPTVAATDHHTPRPAPEPSATETHRAHDTDGLQYRVQRRDTLWGIAERLLGDGHRWREIRDLNAGRPQPDGGTLASDDDRIRPGWLLTLPTDAHIPASDDGEQVDQVTVERGDTLWDLADSHLADPHAWPALYDLNRGKPQPDGRRLTDPDLLLPGWLLDLPTHEPHKPVPPAEIDGERDRTPTHPLPPTQREFRTTGPPHAVTPPEPPADAATRNARDATAADAEHAGSHDDLWDQWLWPAFGAGMLAAGLAATIARLRRVWLRRRHHGDQLDELSAEGANLAQRLTGQATPQLRTEATTAVRALAAGLADLGEAHPPIAGATIDLSGEIAVLLQSPASARLPDGWRIDPADSRQLLLDTTVDLDSLHAQAATSTAAAATLVTVGAGEHTGRQLLLALETCRTLALTGTPRAVEETMLTWAIELATSEHADSLGVWLVGFKLDDDRRWERIRTLETATDTINEVQRTVIGDATTLPDPGDVDWAPQVILAAPSNTDTDVERLVEFTRQHTAAGLATVVARDTAATNWQIEVTDHRVVLRSLQEPVTLHVPRRLTRSEFLAAGTLIDDARRQAAATVHQPAADTDTGPPSTELLQQIAIPPDMHTAALDTSDDRVLVRLLGPVRIDTPDGTQVPAGRVTEAIAYLACHRHRVTTDQVIDALWGGRAMARQRLAETMSRARAALGGVERIPRAAGGLYRLAGSVVTDIETVAWHARRAQHTPEHLDSELDAALDLVRGRPFADVDWVWAMITGAATEAAALVTDVAATLGTHRLERGDTAGALAAAHQGLLAAPESEQLHRLRMRAYHQRGDTDRLHQVMDELRATADEPGPDGDDQLHPATVRLYRTLTSR